MFGIDWDGDGEDGFLDDMVTLELLEDEEEDCHGGGKPNGSCLLFILGAGAAIATPIIGIVKWLV